MTLRLCHAHTKNHLSQKTEQCLESSIRKSDLKIYIQQIFSSYKNTKNRHSQDERIQTKYLLWALIEKENKTLGSQPTLNPLSYTSQGTKTKLFDDKIQPKEGWNQNNGFRNERGPGPMTGWVDSGDQLPGLQPHLCVTSDKPFELSVPKLPPCKTRTIVELQIFLRLHLTHV